MVLQNAHNNPNKTKLLDFLYKQHHLIFLFAYVLLLCKAMDTCYRIYNFGYLHVSLLFFCGILLYKTYCMLKLRIVIRPSTLIFALSVLTLILILNLKQLSSIWDIYIMQNFNSINQGIYFENETYFHQFLPFFIILVPLTTAASCALSSKGAAPLSIILISLYMFSIWNNGLDRLLARYVPYFVLLSILYFSVSKYDYLSKRFINSDVKVTVSFKNILIYTLLTSVSITFAAAAASNLFGVKSIVQLRSDFDYREVRLEEKSKRAAFNLFNYGFGLNSNKLGGPVHLDSLIALKVKASRPTYLRGTIKDYYDGHSWNKSSDAYTVKGIESLVVPNQDFNFKMTGNIDKKPDIEKISVYSDGLATSTLFSPNNTLSISAKGGKVLYDAYHAFILMGKQTVKDPYSLKYYLSNTGVEIFDTINNANYSFTYDTDSTDAAREEYYRANVMKPYSTYLEVSQSITPRTNKLVNAITKDCKTTAEKVAAIKSYLSRNFPYSLEVSQVPDNQDFIDFFIFNEKKGYCTYFATTAAMMCRMAGIPARYVEGFNMDEEKDTAGMYVVRNHRAHAWAEILVSPESDLWCIVDCVPQGVPVNEISNSDQYQDRFSDERYKSGDIRLAKTERSGYNNDSMPDFSSLFTILLYPLFLFPAAALLLLSVYILYRLMMYNRKIYKLLTIKSTIPFYKHLADRLKSIGEGFPEESCELEHVKNIGDKELSVCLEKIVRACYAEHYGAMEDYPAIDKKVSNKLFERYIRRKQGFLKYWYCRIRYF